MFEGLSKDGKPIYVYHFVDYSEEENLWSFQKVTKEQIQEAMDYCHDLVYAWERKSYQSYQDRETGQWVDSKEYVEGIHPFPEWTDIMKERFGMERFVFSFKHTMAN